MFEVYLTPNGPRILESEQKIRIMHSVFHGNRTFAAIQKDTGYSKSSVYTFLKKLVSEGLLRIVDSDDEDRDTKYAQDSHLLMTSVEVDEDHCKIDQPFFMDERYQDNLERWLWGYFIYSSHCSGISISPMLNEVMYEVGRVAGKMDKGNEDYLQVTPVRDMLSKSKFADVDVVSSDGMEYNIDLLFNVTDKSRKTMIYAVASMVCGYLEIHSGKEYRIKIQNQSGDSPLVRVVLEETDSEFERGYRKIEFSDNQSCDFSIFWTGDSYVPVVGEAYNTIVQMLSLKPCSSQQMADTMGVPQSTVSGYLKDLEKKSIIISKRIQKRIEYRLHAIKILDWKNSDVSHYDDAKKIAVKCLEEPEHAIRYCFQFFFYLVRMIGYDYELMVHYFGKRVGSKLLEDFPGESPDKILDMIVHDSHKILSADFAVLSVSPLSIARVSDFDMDDFMAEMYATLYNSMFISLLSNYLNIPYRVKTSSVYGDGNRGYRAIYLPDRL